MKGSPKRGDVEDGFDVTEVRARADELAIRPLAQDQIEGTDDHRFSSPGFSGQRGVSFAQFKSQIIDQAEVFDAECGQHDEKGWSRIRRLC